MAVEKKLIFDIGLHKGLDANFYLRKGFWVVGLEAVPALCAVAAEGNDQYLKSGQLKIVRKALYYSSGKVVEFYVNPEKDDWGSLFKGAAEKGVGKSEKISVETIALQDMITAHGTPYFIKCDIEGGDAIFCEQLASLSERPAFISVEATSLEDLAFLRASGYDTFQIVNQYLNPWTQPPNPPREGVFAEASFSHEMSGLFGRELALDKWMPFADLIRQFDRWKNLHHENSSIMVGWLDVHATTQIALRAY